MPKNLDEHCRFELNDKSMAGNVELFETYCCSINLIAQDL